MPGEDKNQERMVATGVIGVFVLLATSLAMAAWKSNEPYQPDQINRIVLEQQATADAVGQ